MKPREQEFLIAMYQGRNLFDNPPDKQEYYYLTKWSGKGWWNYGVTMRSGWLEPEGKAAAQRLINPVR